MRLSLRLIPFLAAALAGCGADPAGNAADDNVQNDAAQADPASAPALPTVSAPMTRRDLLLAAVEAASNYSAGVDDAEGQRELDGQPFSLAIRFCEGEPGRTAFRSSFDEESRVLRLEVRPDIDAGSPLIKQLSGPEVEAVEGFWIRKPWLLDPACPAGATVRPPAARSEADQPGGRPTEDPVSEGALAQPPSTIGIAEFHDGGSNRSSRRGERSYEVTKRLREGARASPVDLLIEGRLRALPAGKVIVCTGGSRVTAPTCIISARIDKVSVRQPGGEVLAEWSGS